MKKTTLVAEKKIIKSCCKGLKKGSRSEQKRAIKRIQQKFFNGDRNDHHAFEWLAALCTDCSDIRTLDEYAKDCIKAVYTGKGNKVTNLRKTSNKILEELGWVSLVDLWNAFTYSRNVYSALIKDANERCVKPLRVENVLSFAEERWELLKLWEGSTFLNTSPKTDNIYTKVEYDRQRDAIIEVESAIQGSEWIWGNKWFVQSQKYPKLVLLRRWFSK